MTSAANKPGSDRHDRPSVPPVSDKRSGTSSGPSSAAPRCDQPPPPRPEDRPKPDEKSDRQPILDGDLNPVDPFRYCVHCGVDCYHPWAEDGSHDYDPDLEHKPNCPTVTGLYPVTMETLGMRGPDDPYAHGARCMDCGVEFKVGDTYALRPINEDSFEVVCVSCRVLNPEAIDAD